VWHEDDTSALLEGRHPCPEWGTGAPRIVTHPGTVLYALPVHRRLADTLQALTLLEQGNSAIGRFPNGELHVEIDAAPAGRDCIILGAVAPPDEYLLSTLLLGHTLKKEGAREIIALLPYLGYARHDRAEPRKSRAAAWLGEVLRASGVSRVVAIDVHSSLIHQLFPIPVVSISAAPVFAAEIGKLALTDPVVVAPDQGALERCEAVRRAAGILRPLAHLTKTRTPEGVRHSILQGAVGRDAILVDDILDTGATLVSAGEALQQAGVRKMVVMATHGLFTGTAWERLWSLGVTRMYCTDSTPLRDSLTSAPISVLSVAPLLADHLKRRSTAPGGEARR
jgi:ribose-phosphate pyrophosphokinase